MCWITMGLALHLAYQEMVTVLSRMNQGLCLQKVRYKLLQRALAEAVLPGPSTAVLLWNRPKDPTECLRQLLPA